MEPYIRMEQRRAIRYTRARPIVHVPVCLKCGHRWLPEYGEPTVCPACGASPKEFQPVGARFNDGEKVVILRRTFSEIYLNPKKWSWR